jgi:hypothetical protein
MTYEERLKNVGEILNALSEDASTDTDEGKLDFDVYEAINHAEASIERALEYLKENKEDDNE